MLDKSSPMPFYYQVKEMILDRIQTGEFKDGDFIPSEKSICDEFNVSITTVRKALDELVKAGILEKIRGKGSFIKTPKIVRELTGIYGITDDIRKHGVRPGRKVLSFKQTNPNEEVAKILKISILDYIYEFRTLNLADDIPVITSKFYLKKNICPDLTVKNLKEESIYNLLSNRYGVSILRETSNFQAILLDEYEADLLKVLVRSPAILIRALTFDIYDKPFMFCSGLLRGDRFQLEVEARNEVIKLNSNIITGAGTG
ncbi:MAG: GntR family transcriptional regulator [Actinobacteria bacterium]|nr:GntR family transcriptional regulator [Actinomycetota bacterium]